MQDINENNIRASIVHAQAKIRSFRRLQKGDNYSEVQSQLQIWRTKLDSLESQLADQK